MRTNQISEERQLDWIAKIETIVAHSDDGGVIKILRFEEPYFKISNYYDFDEKIRRFQAMCSHSHVDYNNFWYELNKEGEVIKFRVPPFNILYVDQFEEDLNFHFERLTNTTMLKETSETLFVD